MKYNMKLQKNIEKIIEDYQNGESLNSLARFFGTHPTTIRRILERQGIELRHDIPQLGNLQVENGQELIEWAKAQGRLVTKDELAKIAGTKRLNPSYFVKYPELGQYVVRYEQNDLQEYSQKLYDWLQKNNIKYKPNDRTRLQLAVTALLLDEYKNIVIQLNIKAKCVSKIKHERNMSDRLHRASEKDIIILFLQEEDFKDLDSSLRPLLEPLKI